MTIDIRNCIFGFQCNQNWNDLKLTSQKEIRFCDKCKKNVYEIEDAKKLLEAIKFNKCVAIKLNASDDLNLNPIGFIRKYKK